MNVLANIIDSWITKESILKAATRVGITAGGISIHHLQKEKFVRAQAVMGSATSMPSSSTSIDVASTSSSSRRAVPTTPTKAAAAEFGLETPKGVRSGTKEYYQEFCKILIK